MMCKACLSLMALMLVWKVVLSKWMVLSKGTQENAMEKKGKDKARNYIAMIELITRAMSNTFNLVNK